MNNAATSKEALLRAAVRIAQRDGLSRLNIRAAAAESGVAVGTVYNYYPAKADLVMAVVEDFWKNAFHGGLCDFSSADDFGAACAQVYKKLRAHLAQFERKYLRELAALGEGERRQGKALEQRYWAHMRAGLLGVLGRDGRERADAFSPAFPRERFVGFIFSSMLQLLREDAPDSAFLSQVIARLIY